MLLGHDLRVWSLEKGDDLLVLDIKVDKVDKVPRCMFVCCEGRVQGMMFKVYIHEFINILVANDNHIW